MERAHINAAVRLAGNSRTDSLESDSLAVLAALAQRTRLAIFRLLVEHEPCGMVAGAIARVVDAPQNTVSSHLSVLAQADLVSGERQSRNIVYRANLRRMYSLITYLVANCCQDGEGCGAEALLSFCPDIVYTPSR